MKRRLVVATASFLVVLGSSCTAGEPEPPPAGSPSAPASGVLRVGVVGEPRTFDPYGRYASDLTRVLARPVYPSLFRFDAAGAAVPSLAASVTNTPAGVEVQLAPWKWSDGRAITASDVAKSVRRARPPSGFARVDGVTVLDDARVLLRGDVQDWPATLATAAFVLPNGTFDRDVSGGPFRIRRIVPGLEVVYETNERAAARPLVERVRVSFFEDAGAMQSRLEQMKLDVAAVPSTVNVSDRLAAAGIEHASVLASEVITLIFEDSASAAERSAIAGVLDRARLEEGLIRDDGDVAAARPQGRVTPVGRRLSLAIPNGDELLYLLQRAIQLQLERVGIETDLVTTAARTFYGEWETDAPVDMRLARYLRPPGVGSPASRLTMFNVKTYVAWRPGVGGVLAPPAGEGVLWNAHDWSVRGG